MYSYLAAGGRYSGVGRYPGGGGSYGESFRVRQQRDRYLVIGIVKIYIL